ncbi:sigma-70 family RNA polymerase sigma factor [Clostridium swellfunianum]|uniref:sigma-70 family RNA polymerase sigma factor n=1 Tax=Clostridium swellfunianum TaxID=1367462 RepID=UPI00202EE4E7|nr:sigma-70 family RNA polymerase sigma factor [Clostridium swellfunianum]MCM0649045.1 sigma-70 family RNA polymerase sigma factor [Clostridium swellfunianum]
MDFEYEVGLAIKGSKDSFAKLIKYLEPSMYRVSKAILQSDNDCADAMQETILKAYKAIESLKEPQFFKTWLIRILINECKKTNMQKGRIIPMEEITSERIVNDIEDSLSVQELLNTLENDLRSVASLYYFEDLPIKDISGMLSIPEGTVKSRLSRARKKLAEVLKPNLKGSELYGRTSI